MTSKAAPRSARRKRRAASVRSRALKGGGAGGSGGLGASQAFGEGLAHARDHAQLARHERQDAQRRLPIGQEGGSGAQRPRGVSQAHGVDEGPDRLGPDPSDAGFDGGQVDGLTRADEEREPLDGVCEASQIFSERVEQRGSAVRGETMAPGLGLRGRELAHGAALQRLGGPRSTWSSWRPWRACSGPSSLSATRMRQVLGLGSAMYFATPSCSPAAMAPASRTSTKRAWAFIGSVLAADTTVPPARPRPWKLSLVETRGGLVDHGSSQRADRTVDEEALCAHQHVDGLPLPVVGSFDDLADFHAQSSLARNVTSPRVAGCARP